MNQKFLNVFFYLICLIPLLLVTGSFLPDFSLSFISLVFFFFILKNKEWLLFNNKLLYFFIVFYLIINISAIFSIDQYLSFKSVFFYFRFIIFFVAFKYIFENFDNSSKIFLNFFLLMSLVLIIDSFIQYIFGTNFLGMEKIEELNFTERHGARVSGLFGNDEILGSFLSKILPIILSFYFYIKKEINTKFIFLIISLFSLSIFITGERAAFIQTLIFTIFFFIIIDFKYKKFLILSFFIFLTLFSTIIISLDKFKKIRMIDSVYSSLNEGYIISSYHESHYITAFRMFQEKPLIGHGPKSFRLLCNDKKFMYNKYSCSTHPHNTYLQLLSETGILGFLTIFLFFLSICFMLLKYLLIKIFKKKIIYEKHFVIILIGLFVYLWPISPNGNFFNNWLNILFFLQVSTFYFFSKNNIKL